MAKRKHEEEHENHERWLVSYADFLTLLFAFFVVMYSVSRVDAERAATAEKSVRFAMHFEGTGGVSEMQLYKGPPSEGGCVADLGPGATANPDVLRAVKAVAQRIEDDLRPLLDPLHDPDAVSVEAVGNRLAIRLSASRFFDPGGAALRPEVLPVLDSISAQLRGLDRLVRVEGHTDSTPVTGRRFRDNWELSASRAAAVVTYLERAQGFPGNRLAAAGYADSRPVASNDTPLGREENRRVELVLEFEPGDPALLARRPEAETAPDAEPARTPSPTTGS